MEITCTKIIQSQTTKCLQWYDKHVLLLSKDQSVRNTITWEEAHCQVSSHAPNFVFNDRELKQTTTTTAIKMSPKKRLKEQNKWCMCIINLCTISHLPLQNKNLKGPSSA